MFQFLQMSHELIEGLVDCYENRNDINYGGRNH